MGMGRSPASSAIRTSVAGFSTLGLFGQRCHTVRHQMLAITDTSVMCRSQRLCWARSTSSSRRAQRPPWSVPVAVR